jgi:hypothetical protein
MGELIPHLAEQGLTDILVLLDDATMDDAQVDFLKRSIQDGSLEAINFPSLKVEVPLNHLRVIITTNHEPTDEALLSRMAVFHMNTVNPQTKVDLAAEAITTAAQEDIDDLILTETQANLSRQLAYASIRTIVSYDRSPGVRESQNTAKQVYTFISTRVKDHTIPTDEGLEAFIREVMGKAQRSRWRAEQERQQRKTAFDPWAAMRISR